MSQEFRKGFYLFSSREGIVVVTATTGGFGVRQVYLPTLQRHWQRTSGGKSSKVKAIGLFLKSDHDLSHKEKEEGIILGAQAIQIYK